MFHFIFQFLVTTNSNYIETQLYGMAKKTDIMFYNETRVCQRAWYG